ncbi:MAG TPA: GNAT family N-acetyltransferase [Candidatus Thermoplasmatota archaeon]|nr:GNAT family N-acetyltransferase [Candidatus Thermoplasmatota archaeon]
MTAATFPRDARGRHQQPGVALRRMTYDDVDAIEQLERLAFQGIPDDHLWKRGQVEAHLDRFPEGQWVAELDGEVVGSCTNLRIPYEVAVAPHTWHQITGGGYLATHDPEGDALYGTEIMVHPGIRRMGIGRKLFQRRFQYVMEEGLRAFVTGGRLPGYGEYVREMRPHEYVERVQHEELTDPVLTPDLKWGCTPIGILGNYITDPDSAHYACLIEWVNPEWRRYVDAVDTEEAPRRARRVGC